MGYRGSMEPDQNQTQELDTDSTRTPVTPSAEATIDELGREFDIPASTVRMYQNRRLLPPPERRGRVGFYNDEHRSRLRMIAALQDRGFSLAVVFQRVVGAAGRQGAALQLERQCTARPAAPSMSPRCRPVSAHQRRRLPSTCGCPTRVHRGALLSCSGPTASSDPPRSSTLRHRRLVSPSPGQSEAQSCLHDCAVNV